VKAELKKFPFLPIVAGLTLRLLHALFISDSPILKTLVIDSAYYHQQAVDIAGGNIIGESVFFMSPLYPYFMGIVYAVFDSLPVIIVLSQCLLSGATLYLVFKIAEKVGGKTTGLAAVWAGAIFPVWIYFDGVIMTASLILFLNAFSIWMLLRWADSRNPKHIIFAGLLTGLSALARPGALFFGGIVFLWLLFRRKRKAAILLLVGLIVPILPVTIRNLAASGEFAFITSSAGMNFYVGNSEYATGLYSEPPFLHSSEPEYELNDYIAEAERQSHSRLNSTQTSRFWLREGMNYLLRNPAAGLKLYWNKFFYFWNNLEAPNNISFYLVKRYSPVLKFLPFGFGILVSLGMLGFILIGKSESKNILWLYLAGILAMNLIFFTSSEFRFPVIIVLLVGTGTFYDKFIRSMASKKYDYRLIPLLVLFLFFTHYQTATGTILKNTRMDYFNLGSVCLKKGNFEEAVKYFRNSLTEDPSFEQAHMGLGTAYLELEDYKSAAEEFRSVGYEISAEELEQNHRQRMNEKP